MEIFVIDSNTKLVAICYNEGKPPHLFEIRTDVTLFGLKNQLDQINRQLNKETQGGLMVLIIDIHQLTQSKLCGSAR